jgi:hypothetical protein
LWTMNYLVHFHTNLEIWKIFKTCSFQTTNWQVPSQRNSATTTISTRWTSATTKSLSTTNAIPSNYGRTFEPDFDTVDFTYNMLTRNEKLWTHLDVP